MTDCNPLATPITKTMVQKLYKNKHEGLQQTAAEQAETDSIIGKMQWLGQTTHCTLAVALSVYSSILSTEARVAGGLDAARMMLRYVKGTQDRALVKKAGCRTGLKISSDADYAGLWSFGFTDTESMGDKTIIIKETRERRSRTGCCITYNDMPVVWLSKFQNTVMTAGPSGTAESPHMLALSSGESELYAASDTAKEALRIKYIGEEINIKIPACLTLNVDSTAAQGFIDSTDKCTKIKMIDMREEWVELLRNRTLLQTAKVAGPDNEADFFTKILPEPAFRAAEDRMMKKIK